MTRHQARFLCQLMLAGDVALSALAFALAFELRLWLPTTEAGAGLGSLAAGASYGPLLLGMLPLWTLALHVTGSNDVRAELDVAARRQLRAVGLGLVLLIAGGFLWHLQFISRGFVLMLGAAQLVLLWSVRAVVLHVVRHREVDHRVLVVGCDEAAVRFAASLRRRVWSQRIVGFVSVPGQPCLAAATPVLAELDAIAELLDGEPIDEVVFTVGERGAPELRNAIDACHVRGVDVLMAVPSMLPLPGRGRVELAELSSVGIPMLSICHSPTSPTGPAIKRLVDVLGASLLLMITAPVVLASAILLRLESEGPVFTRRLRAGRHGRSFVMVGLRCTNAGTAERSSDHKREVEERELALTRVGRLVRAAGVDVLPQLLNVLVGQMSLVGPRAPALTEVERYEPWQRRRLSVRPGLMGLRALANRSRGSNDAGPQGDGMTLDLRYIDTWSLWLDLEILARSLPRLTNRSVAS